MRGAQCVGGLSCVRGCWQTAAVRQGAAAAQGHASSRWGIEGLATLLNMTSSRPPAVGVARAVCACIMQAGAGYDRRGTPAWHRVGAAGAVWSTLRGGHGLLQADRCAGGTPQRTHADTWCVRVGGWRAACEQMVPAAEAWTRAQMLHVSPLVVSLSTASLASSTLLGHYPARPAHTRISGVLRCVKR